MAGLEIVIAHRERLLAKRPGLRGYKAVPLETIAWDAARCSAFIREIWARHYGDGVHLRFTPQVLEWMTDGWRKDQPSGSIAVLDEHGEVAALVGGTPRSVSCAGQPRRAVLQSALAVAPEHQGHGVGGLALCEQLVVNAASGFEFTLAWHHLRETRENRANSYGAYKANPAIVFAPVRVWGRPVDLPKALRHNPLGPLETLVGRVQVTWPAALSRPPVGEVVLDPVPHAQALAALVRRCTEDRPVRREFDAGDGRAWAGPSGAGFFCALRAGSELLAVAAGFRNALGSASLVYLDSLVIDRKRLSHREALGFLREVERHARDGGSFGLVLPGTASNVHPAGYGFVPVARHMLDATDLRPGAPTGALTAQMLSRAFIDLK